MTSIKNLKKEINSYIMELISECFTYKYFHHEEDDDKVNSIVADLVNLRNELISRINNPDKETKSKGKNAYYRKILDDLYEQSNKLMDKLANNQ